MKKLLRDRIAEQNTGLVFHSLTPPKVTTDGERMLTIAGNQMERLKQLDIDGLILYDIQDEAVRTEKERTFSFIPTLSPEHYSKTFLAELDVPKIIYKSIANQTKEDFAQWLQQNQDIEYAVFVGASSHQQVEATRFSLSDAYALRNETHQHLTLGGVTIPERHAKKNDEQFRMFTKMSNGCSFFVSQCVYNLNDTKSLLSDYYYTAQETEQRMAPIIFTLTPCGSLKTLQFMEWLGIEVPKWLFNDLKHANDILEASIQTSLHIAEEILNYAGTKNIPVGFNVESISIKKDEINAAQELLSSVINLAKPKKRAAHPAAAISTATLLK